MTETPPPSTLSTPSPTEHDPWNQDRVDESKIPSASELQEMNSARSTKPIYLIVATAVKPHLGIGFQGGLPWPLIKADMTFFRKATTGPTTNGSKQNAVIMGRKTYASIPSKFRPLANRVNVILTRKDVKEYANEILNDLASGKDGHEPAEYRIVDQATVSGLTHEAVSIVQRDHEQPRVVVTNWLDGAVDVDAKDVFCIGGAEIYGMLLNNHSLKRRLRVLQTEIRKLDNTEFECDTFWPEEMAKENGWGQASAEKIREWVECDVPQGQQDQMTDESAGVKIRVVGWEREKS